MQGPEDETTQGVNLYTNLYLDALPRSWTIRAQEKKRMRSKQ